MNTVSNAAIADVVDTCMALGVLTLEDVEQFGFCLTTIKQAQLRSSEQNLIDLWAWLQAHSSKPDIGLKIGARINPNAKGILASWVSQADTLEEALNIFQNNIALMNPSESWRFIQKSDTCELILSMDSKKHYPSMALERSMAGFVSWGNLLGGKALSIRAAHFSFPAPSYVSEFKDIFGQNLIFNSEQCKLEIDVHDLKRPVVSSNQFLKGVMANEAKRVTSSLLPENVITEQTLKTIEQIWQTTGSISAEQVCTALAVSRQTLFRRLKKEGTDLTNLMEAFKKQQAINLLEDASNNITGVALMLGYKDSSSFNKAFKRWFGVSPKAYLQR